jgi:hypothetical protein
MDSIEARRDMVVRRPALSLIVRVWPEDGDPAAMRGEVEHVGTGEKRLFLDYWSLLRLIESWRQDLQSVR